MFNNYYLRSQIFKFNCLIFYYILLFVPTVVMMFTTTPAIGGDLSDTASIKSNIVITTQQKVQSHQRQERASTATFNNVIDRRMYFAIAINSTGSSTYTRAFNKTLANITQSFWANPTMGESSVNVSRDESSGNKNSSNVLTYNITLEPLVIELPSNGRFSSNFLERLCLQLEGRHVAAILIVGDSPAAFTVALVAGNSGIPILWARSNSNFMATINDRDTNPFETYIQPGARETLQALRSLFIQTHWHSFTILADDSATSSVLLRKELSSILNSPPLNPTISYLPHTANPHVIFRRLADISRATRGVVILMSDIILARRVLEEAKRLNMVDGHFVWLWIDTGTHQYPSATNSSSTNSTTGNTTGTNTTTSGIGKNTIAIVQLANNSSITSILPPSKFTLKENKRFKRHTNVLTPSDNNFNNISANLIKQGNVPQLLSSSQDEDSEMLMYSYVTETTNNKRSVPQTKQKQSTISEISNLNSNNNKNGAFINKQQSSVYTTDDLWPTIRATKNRQPKHLTKRNIVTSTDDLSIGNHHVNYLLKNDKFLLLNKYDEPLITSDNPLERKHLENMKKFSNKLKNRIIFNSAQTPSSSFVPGGDRKQSKYKLENDESTTSDGDNEFPSHGSANREQLNVVGLPVGLLAIKAMPLKLDRHLIKGAVRLLAITLRNVLAKCPPDWVARSVLVKQWYASCWHPAQMLQRNNDGILQATAHSNFSLLFARELKLATQDALSGQKFLQENGVEKVDKSLVANFEITNLVPEESLTDFTSNLHQNTFTKNVPEKLKWRTVGRVTGRSVHLDTIVWPGGDIVVSGLSTRARSVFRVVTALAPPFVMESELDEDGQCLRGLPCHRVLTSDKDNLTLVFNEMETQERLEEGEEGNSNSHFDFQHSSTPDYNDKSGFLPFQRYKYRTNCCYGLAMDLLENIAQELEFDFRLYIVADGLFGSQIRTKKKRDLSYYTKSQLTYRFYQDGIYKHFTNEFHQDDWEDEEEYDKENVKWNGIVGDLVSGAAHMSFAALSVSSLRSEVIDFSAPFFFSGVSFLAAPQQKSEIPLLAFLLPFSTELWIAIFTSLNITAIAVAVYEWLSPFGLNPWGRQRSKNFSMSSALWVMWGLLCGHLVAFKAPKSWPNKFLINVWGGFSVIFVASYTANIAALIAGLFFHNAVSNYHDRSLLSQKVGAPMASAAEYYVQRANRHLWDHMHKYKLANVEEGVQKLRNGSLDILIADTPILDYYRATDHGCKLQKIGDTINEDAYAVGMTKGFPLKDSISAVIAKYASNGYMDILQEKWYGGLPCFKLATEMAQPRPLGVAAVTGVFILLGFGVVMGCLILFVEHWFYRYALPILRHKPKGTIWRSRNIMFFSQKLYRFINCVELVSPHHAARELVHTIRQGQITSLFQKSVKRKEHEQRRRRKSKAQFFEMIQEIRRVQQEERDLSTLESVREVDVEKDPEGDDKGGGNDKRQKLSPNIIRRTFMRASNPKIDTLPSPKKPFVKQIFSPRIKMRARSASTLNVRRFSTDSVFFNSFNASNAIGRRLSRDPSFLNSSPPDVNSRRSSYLDVANTGPRMSLKSPVLSIENISDQSLSDNPTEMVRKLSDSESIGRKLATLPKYKEVGNKSSLNVENDLSRRKSDIIITSTNKYDSNELSPVQTAKSVQNIPVSSKTDNDEIQLNVSKAASDLKPISDEEIERRSRLTIQQLQARLKTPKSSTSSKTTTSQKSDTVKNKNPQIRIEIEDTTREPSSKPSVPTPAVPRPKRTKQRHRSLGDHSQNKHQKLQPQSRSLDSSTNTEKSDERRNMKIPINPAIRCEEHDLPPAPPPPNCSPRNSNGRSPLERLSKDELVLLWRSSESELRSHLLKALREKNVDDPP